MTLNSSNVRARARASERRQTHATQHPTGSSSSGRRAAKRGFAFQVWIGCLFFVQRLLLLLHACLRCERLPRGWCVCAVCTYVHTYSSKNPRRYIIQMLLSWLVWQQQQRMYEYHRCGWTAHKCYMTIMCLPHIVEQITPLKIKKHSRWK